MAEAILPGDGEGRPGAVHLSKLQPGLLPAAKRVDGRPLGEGHCRLQWSAQRDKKYGGICENAGCPGAHSLLRGHTEMRVPFRPSPSPQPETPPPASHPASAPCDPDPSARNRLCNLEYGTRRENILGVFYQGKAWRKLNIEDVEQIRFGLSSGISGAELARMYGVSQSEISHIKQGRTFSWK